MKGSVGAVLLAGIALRLATTLVFPTLQQTLDKSVEFSTPITSFKSLREGIYLLNNDLPVYDGGVVHHSPMLLAILSIFNGSEFLVSLFYTIIDSLIALNLIHILNYFQNSINFNNPTWAIGLLYLFNPLSLLTCISRSSTIFNNLFISYSIYFALNNNLLLASIFIALASNISIYSLLLILPVSFIIPKNYSSTYSPTHSHSASIDSNKKKISNNNNANKISKLNCSRLRFAIFALLSFTLLIAISFIINNSNWNFIYATFWMDLSSSKNFPNLGLWWYFFIEMFDSFIPFYKTVFNLFIVSIVLTISIRFNSSQPFYSLILSIGWITLTKPYPTLGDISFFIGLIPFFKPLFGYLKYPVISSLLFLHAILLSPIFYHIWIDVGSGNSNFFYAINLVYALSVALIITEFCWAMLRCEYDKGSPNYKAKVAQI
ncbi:hypothetical protein TBLA_0B04920 [Henningerozyma blattae CBS 6284]|uniref:GPI transamidase component GAB1 n=1 Tax=Henningerozyma blattae (strain ATCC 34711 / CBS 6284 / DSM 70876 / NBRC 10599 / NRRL Y-10934 / UCD 77-7) TaxID=1071380 RepID=I2GYX4_HENB6|nr:hypothetical protein TBLA_0B04920 [Tetrapisispora blattae CBS 6284]CCH59326.1 hypothetical protein TBLA_0B04920 [Tetrapisispora blattae CBS 6284]